MPSSETRPTEVPPTPVPGMAEAPESAIAPSASPASVISELPASDEGSFCPVPCDLTIVIPTYNSADRLHRVFAHLAHQVSTDAIRWEVIVVDNNSTDHTAEVVRVAQVEQLLPVPLHYCFEERQGAAFARQRGVDRAQGQWVGFLDDDNLPASNWVAEAIAFTQAHPEVGGFGSQIHGVFAVDNLPDGFERIRAFFAIVERGNKPKPYHLHQKLLPPSAGLVVKRQAWITAVPRRLMLHGRTTTTMLTSEDLEALIYMQRAGWELWYNPAMEVNHHIPPHRLSRDYLIPFFRGIGLSRYVIRQLRISNPWKRWFTLLAHTGLDVGRLVRHAWRYRDRLGHDLVIDCEWELYRSSLISPWVVGHLVRKQRKQAHQHVTLPDPVPDPVPTPDSCPY